MWKQQRKQHNQPTNNQLRTCLSPESSFRLVNLMLMRRMLESLGIVVVTAITGEDSIARCYDSGPFDVVFMDVYMPGMGGIAAAAAIRQAGLVASHVHIYVLTASNSQGIEAECMAAGATRVLTKPVEKQTFVKLLIDPCSAAAKDN